MPFAQSREAIDFYNELLEGRHFDSTREILARASERHKLFFGARPVCTVLRPYLIDEALYSEVRRISALVMRGISALGKRLFQDARLRGELDLTREEEELSMIPSGYGAPDVSARLDGFLSPGGEFNFVEYNAESPGGLAYGAVLGEAFASMPVMQEFASRYDFRSLPIRDYVFEALIDSYHRWGGRGLPNVGIVDWRGVSTYSEFVLMKEHFESKGCRVRIADPDELEYRNGRLFAGDFPVDLVYKRVVIGELLAKVGARHPLVEAVKEGAVCMSNGFGVQMLYKKGIFAMLSDEANSYLFEPRVSEALAKHIPWTRKVRECETNYRGRSVDLLPFIEENRENLVLKPNGEYGGKGVVLGWESDGAVWGAALREALSGSYIVQERVPLGREPFPSVVDGKLSFDERYFDLDPYVWRGEQVEGAGVRLSSLALLNVSAGGGSATPMFIISERDQGRRL
ncbi:MAG TPA: hypothetical protein VE262_12450 [Blastocatellia bacterium]|nr:hypothetical protein [Blastocatellia bacterium]